MVTHYHSSSRGPVEIASMRYEHALNARDKLTRERVDASRDAEIDALNSHIAAIEATFQDQTEDSL